ncbi:MAG TPA: glutathione S-transferase family protein [Brevundimonas sp.]|jgi:glutathione S-transferase
MLTLFHAPLSRSSRLIWLMEELGADYEICYCDIARRDGSGGRDRANPHPDGKVPALIHDGALISECAAVALYLTDLHPEAGMGVSVGHRDRGEYLTWLAWAAGEMEPVLGQRLGGYVPTDPYSVRRYEAVVDRLLDRLWSAPYLMGDRFSAADVMIGATLMWARAHLPESPTLDSYVARISERPARRAAMEKDGDIAVASSSRAA